MNVKARDADSFLAALPPDLPALLLYGPDAGLVSERAKAIVAKIVGKDGDPFGVVELTRRDLETDPRRLADELAAIPLTGGRPVVRLRDVTDSTAEVIEAQLEGEAPGGLLLVEAGDLPARSALREVFGGDRRAAAVPCYLDDAGGLSGLVRDVLHGHGLSAERDALAELCRSMGSDRLVSRRELEKLVDYMGPAPEGSEGAPRKVALEDVRACVGDSAEVTLDDLAFAAASGDKAALERAFERAQAAGVQPVAVLRAVTRHFGRLHQAAAALAEGLAAERAVASVRPAVFWKVRAAFTAQVQAWSLPRLRAALVELLDCEVELKVGGVPQALVAHRALLRLAANAPRRVGR